MRTYADFTEEEKEAYKKQLKEEGQRYLENYYRQAQLNAIEVIKPYFEGVLPQSYWEKRKQDATKNS